MKIGVFSHNKIKDSFINFYSSHQEMEFLRGFILPYEAYFFEVDRNLNNFVEFNNFLYSLFVDRQNNKLELTTEKPYDKDFMKTTNKIFYTLNFIDNKFYTKDKESNYLYFGGIPQNLNETYNLFSLKGLTYINFKIEVKFDNGTKYETNTEKNKISFSSSDKYIICFTRPIFNLLKKSILKNYDDEYCNRTYVHDEYNFEEIRRHYRPLPDNKLNTHNFKKEMKNLFPDFKITIGNKVLNLNKNNIFRDHDDIYTDLLIGSSPCNTIRFGKYFFELFDYSEYDKDTEIVKIYLEKNNSVFKEIEENIDDIKYIKTSKFDILILCSIIFMVTIFDLIIINKDKNKNYPINYYEISLF